MGIKQNIRSGIGNATRRSHGTKVANRISRVGRVRRRPRGNAF